MSFVPATIMYPGDTTVRADACQSTHDKHPSGGSFAGSRRGTILLDGKLFLDTRKKCFECTCGANVSVHVHARSWGRSPSYRDFRGIASEDT